MEKLTFVTVLLLVGLNVALAREEQAYFVIGGKLNLRPSVSGDINALLWKHNGNLVVEWVRNEFDLTYGNFRDRTNTNKTTGALEITSMTAADAGVYTVEINYKDQGLRYNAILIEEVPEVAQEKQAYFVIGGKLNLRPSVSGDINAILWKHNGNLVVEWVRNKFDLTYGNFRDRTYMNKTTGALVITNMTEADAGLYTVEINNKDQGLHYNATPIKEVPKPSVLVRPVACSLDSKNCTLTCDGETEGAGPVDYNWNFGNRRWRKLTKVINIPKRSAFCVSTLTCQMKNPVSERESDPKDNPLFTGEGGFFSVFRMRVCEKLNDHFFPNSTNLNSS